MRALPGRRIAVVFTTTVAAGAFAGAANAAPSITVSKPADLQAGDSVVVKGKGFDVAPATADKPAPGIYVGVATAAAASTNARQLDRTVYVFPGAQTTGTTAPLQSDGTFEVTLTNVSPTFGSGTAAVDCRAVACGVRTLRAHFNADRSQDTYRPVNFRSATSVAALSGGVTWGVKESFRTYIRRPFVAGDIQTEGGVTQAPNNGVFTFPFSSGSVDPTTGRAFVQTAGSVHFTGHAGQLDLRISDVRVLGDGTDRRIIADVVSKSMSSGTVETYEDVDLSALDAAAQPTTSLAQSTWTAVPTTLTAEGAPAFAGFYSAGAETDPVTFSASTEGTTTDPGGSSDGGTSTGGGSTGTSSGTPSAATTTSGSTSTTAAATKPATTKASPKVSKSSLSPKRLRFRVSTGSTVTARIQRQVVTRVRKNGKTKTTRRWANVRTLESTKRTAGWVSLNPKLTKAGTYRITVRATSTDGVEGKALVLKQRITQAAIRRVRSK